MAKLTKAQQKATAEADSGGFTPIPGGIYPAKCEEVDTDNEGAAGPYWKFTYVITKGKFKGRKQWTNMSLSPDSGWKRAEMFEAHGLDLDSDSDDFVGGIVRLEISEGTIGKGPKKGEPTNNVDKVLSAEGAEDDDGGDESNSGGSDDEPDLDELGTSADDGDDDAIATLTQMAESAEKDPDDFGTWAELATALKPKKSAKAKPPAKSKAKGKPSKAAAKDDDFEF